jgi:hypothetical protein
MLLTFAAHHCRPELSNAGHAMVWFAHHWVAYLIYMPVSIAVLLLPWSRMNSDTPRGQQLLLFYRCITVLLVFPLATSALIIV